MALSHIELAVGKPTYFLKTCPLSPHQVNILIRIALVGPNDAYRINKELNSSLSTTQLAFKKLKNDGLIQLRETVKGETDQIRKIYSLTPFGFCLITTRLFDPKSGITYDQLKKFIDMNSNLLPELLKKWDIFIENSKEYFSHNPVKDWECASYLIHLPDISTEIWCLILLKTCESIIDDYSYDNFHDNSLDNLKTINEKALRDGFREALRQCLIGYFSSPDLEGLIFALKQDRDLINDMIPILTDEIDMQNKSLKRLLRIYNEIK
jgi:DNA-binding MarR family transcriptional regulator